MDNPNEFEFCALESPPKADSRIGNLLPAWRPRWTGILPVSHRAMKVARVSRIWPGPETRRMMCFGIRGMYSTAGDGRACESEPDGYETGIPAPDARLAGRGWGAGGRLRSTALYTVGKYMARNHSRSLWINVIHGLSHSASCRVAGDTAGPPAAELQRLPGKCGSTRQAASIIGPVHGGTGRPANTCAKPTPIKAGCCAAADE